MARAAAVGLGALMVAVAVPFFVATTFIGDDHLFLAFARHAPNPLAAFWSDCHGGEYYRPLPMLVWWLLGRTGAGRPLFALLALALHTGAAVLVGLMLRALDRPLPIVWLSAALMFVAPQNLDAAYWFSASTDLFATVFVLSSLLALLRRHALLSAVAALAAYLSKESAFALPLLALVMLRSKGRAGGIRAGAIRAVLPHAGLLAVVVALRVAVLHGWGGGGDAAPGLLGRGLQLAGGVSHLFTAPLPEPWAFALGAAAILAAIVAAAVRRGAPPRFAPFLFTAVALAPLGAAGWAVGARYYYLPAVGLVWGMAEVLAGSALAARITLLIVVMLLGMGQAAQRRRDVVSYDRRVAAARRAVIAGLREGHRVYHIDGGIKDLDLAIKEDERLAADADGLLILADVPASFAIVPPRLRAAATIVVAAPPIPPSGGYRFGDITVVGLARRGDEPTLDEVLAKLPDLRFIRLRPTPTGQIVARDMTDAVRGELDLGPDPEHLRQN
jgi:hypothetical protein